MSTHGRSGLGRWLYGSVADQVLRRANVPVMLVSPGCPGSWAENSPVRVMLALDGSDQAAEALGPATELAAALQAEIILLKVVESPETIYSEVALQAERIQVAERAEADAYLEKIAAQLRPSTPWPVAVRVARGPAAATIASTARDVHADAIVMATHGRAGLARIVLGSVTTGVLQQANVPLLVYRPSAVTKPVVDSDIAAAELLSTHSPRNSVTFRTP
jgi:nucleotide-binding universal stress UspA family protein